jgi:hypothetical protein
MEAVQAVSKNLLAPLPLLLDHGDAPLQVERQLLARSKKALLLCAGVAVQAFDTEMAEQQEVLGVLADMAIAIYAAESALLRTLKHLESHHGNADQLRLDITRAWCRALPEQIERLGSTVLAVAAEGDALHTPLAALKKLTRATPINSVALKRRIAAAAIEAERYPLG